MNHLRADGSKQLGEVASLLSVPTGTNVYPSNLHVCGAEPGGAPRVRITIEIERGNAHSVTRLAMADGKSLDYAREAASLGRSKHMHY
jgi:hypothetical protein